jgi:hypothetical protein
VTAATAVTAGPEPVVTPGLAGLLGELSDLKRVRVAGRDGSLAEQGFARSWAALAAGDAPADVALRETARALAAVPLGGIDGALLAEAGVDDAGDVLRGAVDLAAGDRVDPALRAALRSAVTGTDPEGAGPPAFVAALAAQPRAGATAPGRPRLVLEPPESHADHCFAVAVGAVLLAPGCGATPARASSARSRTTCTTRACPTAASPARSSSARTSTRSSTTSPAPRSTSCRPGCAPGSRPRSG